MQENYEKIAQLVKKSKRIVITAHMSPDGDAVGSVLAIYHWVKKINPEIEWTKVVLPNAVPAFLQWLPKAEEILAYDIHTQAAAHYMHKADLVIGLDFNETSRVGGMSEWLEKTDCPIVLIDHHLHPMDFATICVSQPSAPATCLLVHGLIVSSGVVMDKDMGTCVYCGLMTDTGNFAFNSNSAALYRVIADLMDCGVDKDAVFNAVFNQQSVDRMRLVGYCLAQKMVVIEEYHTAIIYLSKEELAEYHYKKGDTEGIVNMPLQCKDIYYSCLMRETEATAEEKEKHKGEGRKINISLRSQGDRPVNIMARELFNGGGHKNASGGEYYGSIEDAVARFMDGYKAYLSKE